MQWQAEKMCSQHGGYDLSVERFKHGYACDQSNDTWKWRVINSGVVVSQGTAVDLDSAQKMAEQNLPLNQ